MDGPSTHRRLRDRYHPAVFAFSDFARDCHPFELLDDRLAIKSEREEMLFELLRRTSDKQQDVCLQAALSVADSAKYGRLMAEAHASSTGKSLLQVWKGNMRHGQLNKLQDMADEESRQLG